LTSLAIPLYRWARNGDIIFKMLLRS